MLFFFVASMKCPSIHNSFKKYNVLLFVLFNRDMIVNLYKLYFQLNKTFFIPSLFHRPNQTRMRDSTFLSFFYFLFSYFSIIVIKRTLIVCLVDWILEKMEKSGEKIIVLWVYQNRIWFLEKASIYFRQLTKIPPISDYRFSVTL